MKGVLNSDIDSFEKVQLPVYRVISVSELLRALSAIKKIIPVLYLVVF